MLKHFPTTFAAQLHVANLATMLGNNSTQFHIHIFLMFIFSHLVPQFYSNNSNGSKHYRATFLPSLAKGLLHHKVDEKWS